MAVLNILALSALTVVAFAVPSLRNGDFTLKTPARQIALGVCKTRADCVDRDKIELNCVGGVCTPLKLGATCLTSIDCTTFLACTSGTCQPGTPGSVCEMWRQCSLGNTCVDRTCTPGVAGAACIVSYSCADGLTCSNQKCVAGVANAPCRTDKDCVSGTCRIRVAGPFASGVCTIPLPTPSPSTTPSAAPSVAPSPPPSPAAVVSSPAATPPATSPGTTGPLTPITSISPAAAPVSADPTTTGQVAQEPVQAEQSGSPVPAATPASASLTPSPSATVPAPNTAGSGSASAGSPSPNATTTAQPICIGASSHRAGVSLRGLLRPVHRMQLHPLRALVGPPRVLMHCFQAAGGRLCASASHVVEYKGELMYMADFCRGRKCTLAMEVPLNFKGLCGEHIEFAEGLSATQHSAQDRTQSAAHVARMECALRARNRALWTVRTL